MEFKEVLKRVYDACDSIGVTGNEKAIIESAIIESATKIYIAGVMNNKEHPNKEEIEKFLGEYNEKILFRDKLSAHDWNVASQVMRDIKLFLNDKFRF